MLIKNEIQQLLEDSLSSTRKPPILHNRRRDLEIAQARRDELQALQKNLERRLKEAEKIEQRQNLILAAKQHEQSVDNMIIALESVTKAAAKYREALEKAERQIKPLRDASKYVQQLRQEGMNPSDVGLDF